MSWPEPKARLGRPRWRRRTFDLGSPAGLSGADHDVIRVIGPNVTIGGALSAPSGGVELIGLGGTFRCGVVAETIRVLGAGNRFVVDEGCLG